MTTFRFFFLLLIFSLSTFSFASEDDIPPIAAYKPENSPYPYEATSYIFGLEDEPVEIGNAIIWSPDGTKLVFYRGYKAPLGVYDLLTEQTWFLDIEVYDTRLSFSLGGEYLIYSAFDWDIDTRYSYQDEYGDRWHPIVANRIRLERDSEPELIGIIYYLSPWRGGAGSCIADVFITSERGWGGDIAQETILLETPYGILADSPLTLRNYENDTEHVFEGVLAYESEVSPSRTRLATISNGFDVISLDTFDSIHYATSVKPDTSFAWSRDEQFIYYATNEIEENLSDTLSEEEKYLLDDGYCVYRRYTSSIHQLNLEDSTDTELYRNSFYGIGSIMPDPEGKYLYFTAIPDAMPEWVERIRAGDCDKVFMCYPLFYPDLYRLNLENGAVELILEDVIKATPNFAWE